MRGHDLFQFQREDTAIAQFKDFREIGLGHTDRMFPESGIGADAFRPRLGIRRPVDLPEFHRALFGQLFQRRATGQLVGKIAALFVDGAARAVQRGFDAQIGAGLFEGHVHRLKNGVHREQRRPQRRFGRPGHARLLQREDRLTRRAQIGLGDFAQINVVQRQAAFGGQLLEIDLAGVQALAGLGGGFKAGKDQLFDHAPLGLLEFVDALFIQIAQRLFIDLDRVFQHLGRQPDIVDLADFGRGETVGIGLMPGLQRRFVGGGNGHGQVGGGQLGPADVAGLKQPADGQAGHRGRSLDATGRRALKDAAGDVHAQVMFEFVRAQALAAQGVVIDLAAELAVQATEGLNLQKLLANRIIPDRDAQPVRLILKGGRGEQFGHGGLLQAKALRLGGGQVAPGAGREILHLALHDARILLVRDLDLPDRADDGGAAAEIGDAKATQPQDQQTHQQPNDG